jgi:hypothetical protein
MNASPSAVPALTPNAAPQDVSAFVQSFGINSHLRYPGIPYYGQPQRLILALQYLGINTIRDQSPAYIDDRIAAAVNHAVAAAGIRFDALIPESGPVNIGSLVTVYDPMRGVTPVAAYSNISKLANSVTDHPVIVQVN